MNTFNTILVIGGTTDGIGNAFCELIRNGEDYHKLIVPTPQELDVTNPVQVENYLGLNGPMDYVFYCAGTKHLNWLEQMSIDDIKNTFDVNVFGFINVIKGLIQTQHAGRVCCITSDAAITPMRTSLDYCSSKAALQMAIKCIAREVGLDWQITGIMPAAVEDTDMTRYDIKTIAELRNWTEPETHSRLITKSPQRMMISKDDVAELAHWLLFKSPYTMSGSIVEIRGGQ